MKNKITYIFLLLLTIQFGFSQDNDTRKERIKALKIAFISQKLSLSSDEAEKFWPIYNRYDEKIMVLKEAQLKLRLQKRNGTDDEALKKIEEAEEKEAEVMILKKKMRAELIPVISAEKVLKLEQLEQEFHRKLFLSGREFPKKIQKSLSVVGGRIGWVEDFGQVVHVTPSMDLL